MGGPINNVKSNIDSFVSSFQNTAIDLTLGLVNYKDIAYGEPLVQQPLTKDINVFKAALNARRKHQGLPEVDAFDFLNLVKAHTQRMKMSESFLHRGVNEGFSGGEKNATKFYRWPCWNPNWRSWMKRIPASILMPSVSLQTV